MAGKSWAQSLALFRKWMNSGEIIPPDNQRVCDMMWAAWQKAMTVYIVGKDTKITELQATIDDLQSQLDSYDAGMKGMC